MEFYKKMFVRGGVNRSRIKRLRFLVGMDLFHSLGMDFLAPLQRG
jgi:hypothetical protein